jgi:uncharacterized repeat protein (TIGR03803 family)
MKPCSQPPRNSHCRQFNMYALAASAAVVLAAVLTCVITASGQTQIDSPASHKYKVLYTFTGETDGGGPEAGLIRDTDGNLYGTTVNGGDYTYCSCGVVFRVSKTGVETVLFTFTGDQDTGGPDGAWPAGTLARDAAGNLYGTTSGGGLYLYWLGVAFKLDPTGKETVLHRYKGPDGAAPLGLMRDAAGNLYGVTPFSSGNCGGYGCGVVYRLNRTGGETVLHRFSGGTDGAFPFGDLLRDAKGNLYGTASIGGDYDQGVAFKLDQAGRETVIHSFKGGVKDGAAPYAGLLSDRSGNLYGTTRDGGRFNNGTVFKIDKAGREAALYSFTGALDGGKPYGGLVSDPDGNLYGTTSIGGSSGYGVLFRLNTQGTEVVLHNFNPTDGATPGFERLVRDDEGNLYGTTSGGGAFGWGVVFELTP